MPLKYANLWWLLHRNVPDDEVMKNWNTAELDKAIDMFPKNCIYMRWHYEDPTILPHRMLLNWYHKKGLKVMGATSASTGKLRLYRVIIPGYSISRIFALWLPKISWREF